MGVPAQFLVWEFALRVIFLKKFYQWSYIYLKHFDCETCFFFFVLVIFEGYKKQKWTNVGPFYVTSFTGREGDWTFQPCYFWFSFSNPGWMDEWARESSFGVALSRIFHEKHCTPSLSLKKIFHVRDVWECKTWIPSPLYTPLVKKKKKKILESGFMNWTISWFFCFLKQDGPSEIILCRLLLNRLPSLYYLQCTHLLIVSSCVLDEESRHLVSM